MDDTDLDLLKWSAGVDVAVPSLADVDVDRLLPAFWQHKLTDRFLARVYDERPEWIDSPLLDATRVQANEVRRNIQTRFELLGEIEAAELDPGQLPVVIVKGITSFALTGDRRLLRRTNDIDLLWHDPAGLTDVLASLGYHTSDDHCRNHEYSAVYRHGVKVDVHNYFPVETPRQVAVLGPSNGHRVLSTSSFLEAELSYDFLRSSAQDSGLAGLRVPSIEVAVLIAVAHSYREYAHQPFALPNGTVRIGELLEIQRLSTDPRFDPTRFAALVEMFQAGTSVGFVSHMLTTGLGLGQLPGTDDGDGDRTRYPRDLWLDGFVVAEREVDPDVLFLRPRDEGFASVVDMAGGARQGREASYATAQDLGAPTPPTRLVQGQGVPAIVTVTLSDASLRIAVQALDGTPSLLHVMVNTGDVLHEIGWDRATEATGVTWQRNNAANKQWRHEVSIEGPMPSDDSLVLRIPLEALDPPATTGELPLLVGVRDVGEQVGTVIPIVIDPDAS